LLHEKERHGVADDSKQSTKQRQSQSSFGGYAKQKRVKQGRVAAYPFPGIVDQPMSSGELFTKPKAD
jgi:hypothetical protein